jgi:hypothetical protein
MINVIIVDDGINGELYHTGSLSCDLEITPELNILERSEYDRYLHSHGTVCAAIIKKYIPDAEIGSIKVLNDNGYAVRDQLIAALLWCADNAVRLVNLSLGTIDFRDYEAVRKAVNYAAQKGVILVSACNNKNRYTYPASFSNVIGVKCDIEDNLKEGEYRYNYYPLDGIDITACASHFIEKYDGSGKTISVCNSFAAPMITAIAYNILRQSPSISLEEMKYKLAEGAVNSLPGNWHANIYQRIDWVDTALVFNVTCAEKLKMPYRFTVKSQIGIECADSGEGMEKVLGYIKKNRDVLNGIDTVVVNFANSAHTANDASLIELVCILEHMGKNLVFLDDHWPYQNIRHTGGRERIKIFYPSVCKAVTGAEKKNIGMPVAAVYDFSGAELLNCLSKLQSTFRKNGYNAIAASYTCKGLATGAEYMSDIDHVLGGESGSISLEQINRVYSPDIILLGIDASNKEPDYFEELEARYEIDIKIIISNEKSLCIQVMADSETESEIIPVTVRDKYKNDAAEIVDISDEFYTEILYRQLIQSLQQ